MPRENSLAEGRVYAGTFFTPDNVRSLLEKAEFSHYFAAPDMVMIASLTEAHIYAAISAMVRSEDYPSVLTDIGSVGEIYGTPPTFGDRREIDIAPAAA